MTSLQGEVFTLLSELTAPVYYQYPQTERQLPCVCFHESENRSLARADGRERLTALEYTVDCYARSPEGTATLASAVDTALADAGFRRVSARDLYDADARAHRKRARYAIVLSQTGDRHQ